jgi:glutaconate CoA-transferase subunit B
VVTTLGILGYDKHSCRMKLLSLQPGASVEEVIENTGFELALADEITQNDPPSTEELRILREEVDKDKFYI